MRVNDMALLQNFDANKSSGSNPSKVSTESQVFKQRFTPIDEPFKEIDWNHMLTKSEPKMSDEEFEKAIWDMAQEDAASGVKRGGNSKKHGSLMRDYISVASPDRKAAYEESMKKTGGKMNATSTFFANDGTKLMHYNKSSGFWLPRNTPAEQDRLKNFNKIYNEAYRAYEAQHGKVQLENDGPGRIREVSQPW